MLSIQAKMLNLIFQKMPAEDVNVEHNYPKERAKNAARKVPKCPTGITLQETLFDGISGEIIIPVNARQDKIIWFIHGGGCTTGSAKESRECTYYLTKTFGYTIISTNYRLSPEYKWPAQLNDCMKVYNSILSMGYDMRNVVLVGGSAGGWLALSVTLRVRDEGKILPKAVCAFSPITNQADDLPSHHGNEKTDYMLKNTLFCERQNRALFGTGKPSRELLLNSYISPYYGNYKGMPPIFLAVSDLEVLYDDAVTLYEKLKAEKIYTELEVGKGLCHAYATLPMMPEAKKTLSNAVKFAESIS